MGIISNALGEGLGNGMVAYGSQLAAQDKADELARSKYALLREQNDSKWELMLAKLQATNATNAAKAGGGSKVDALEADTGERMIKAGGAFKALGADLNPTDKANFQRPETLLVPNDDEGNAMPATGRTELDQKGYSETEEARQAKVERVMLLVRDPKAIESVAKGDAQILRNQVAEMALKNPKLSVAELADRVALTDNGSDDRVDLKDGVLFRKSGAGPNGGIIERGLNPDKGEATREDGDRKTSTELLQAATRELADNTARVKALRVQLAAATSEKDRVELRSGIKELEAARSAIEVKRNGYEKRLATPRQSNAAGPAAKAPAGTMTGGAAKRSSPADAAARFRAL